MRIRRFVADDMRGALQLVREAHGPDAVILSNRRTEEGVEIVAASNYDEAFVQRALVDAERERKAVPAEVAPPVRVETDDAALSPSERWLKSLAPDASPVGQPVPAPARAADPQPGGHAAAPAPPADPGTPVLAGASATGPEPPSFANLLTRHHTDPDPVPAKGPAPDPVPTTAPARPHVQADPGDGNPAPTPLVSVPSPPAAASDGELAQLRGELAQMRQMIEREMTRLTDERLRGSPVRALTMDLMDDYGFDAGITRDVALQIPADTPEQRARALMLGLISKRLPVCPIDPLHDAGIIALVGPTGAGKTTTIAKLAALYAAQHQPRDVALVTTDTVRVGGRDQLYSYGRQLGIAVHEANSEAGLLELLQRLQDYRLVLIDTAGLSQRDRALAAQLNWLRAARQVRTLLVLPANTHFADLDEVVRRFQHARPQGAVLTKLDETGRLGSALSVVVDHQLPLAWITDGQRVPDDLRRANAAHLVLRLEDLRRAADKSIVPEYHDAIA